VKVKKVEVKEINPQSKELEKSARVKRCPICGAPIEPGAKYCWNCGARLS
jgi:predicted amidophosphoribosyltransferase